MAANDIRDLYPIIPYKTDDIIEHIESNAKFYGGNSLRIMHQCYLTNKIYPNNDELISVRLHGTRRRYPYNSITIHPLSLWMFRCMELYHTILNNCIPYNSETVKLDIPDKIKVMRSSGKLCDGTFTSDFGLRLGHSGDKNELCFNVHFNPYGEDIEDPIKERDYLEVFKDINYEKIKEYNNNFKEISITFNNFSEKELEDALKEDPSKVKKEVMEHFNRLLKEWIKSKLSPIIKANENIIKIKWVIN